MSTPKLSAQAHDSNGTDKAYIWLLTRVRAGMRVEMSLL